MLKYTAQEFRGNRCWKNLPTFTDEQEAVELAQSRPESIAVRVIEVDPKTGSRREVWRNRLALQTNKGGLAGVKPLDKQEFSGKYARS